MKAYRSPTNFGMLTDTLGRGALPLAGELYWLKDQGFKIVVDLSDRHRPLQELTCKKIGAEYIKCPLSDRLIDRDMYLEATKIVLAADEKAFFHCWKGRHRTGAIAALVRRSQGWASSTIIDELMSFGFGKPEKHSELWMFICTELGVI